MRALTHPAKRARHRTRRPARLTPEPPSRVHAARLGCRTGAGCTLCLLPLQRIKANWFHRPWSGRTDGPEARELGDPRSHKDAFRSISIGVRAGGNGSLGKKGTQRSSGPWGPAETPRSSPSPRHLHRRKSRDEDGSRLGWVGPSSSCGELLRPALRHQPTPLHPPIHKRGPTRSVRPVPKAIRPLGRKRYAPEFPAHVARRAASRGSRALHAL